MNSLLGRFGRTLALLTVCAALPMAGHADTVNREAAYKAALPLYQDNARQPLALKIVGTTNFPNARMLRFSYASAHGQRVPALLYVPLTASVKKPVPCLVLLHGLGGTKEMMAGMALFAASQGYASLAIDLYGQGERAASEPLAGLPPDKQLLTMVTVGIPQTVLDVRRALDYLDTRPNIDHKRLGLIGISMGAIIGADAAGVDPRLKATVLISGGGGLAEIVKNLADHGSTVGGHNMAAFKNTDWTLMAAAVAPEDPLTFAAHIAPRALLMECGRKDTTILPSAAQALYDAAKAAPSSHVRIDWYDNAGHVPPPNLIDKPIEQWLAKNL